MQTLVFLLEVHLLGLLGAAVVGVDPVAQGLAVDVELVGDPRDRPVLAAFTDLGNARSRNSAG